jgi:HlyD family secretion protein
MEVMVWSKRRGVILAIAGILLGIGLFVWLRHEPAPPPKYETARVERGDIADRVIATGTLSPLVTVTVGSQVSGRVIQLGADFNSTVKKGQLIAKIDPALFRGELDRARANLAAAHASLSRATAERDNAALNSKRYATLAAKNMVAQAEADTALAALRTAEASVASARAAIDQARAAVTLAETNLAYTEIVSPIDGVVISRGVDVGQTVAASFQAPTLFTIAEDPRKMEVHTSVAESDVGRVLPGQNVDFTVDAFVSKTFKGIVKEVRYSPVVVQNVVTYDAVVSVDNPELELRPGMTADVTFQVESHQNVLFVPSAALRFRPPEAKIDPKGKRIIWKLAEGAASPVRVEVGLSDGERTEISGEIAEGDTIITGMSGGPKRDQGQGRGQRFGRFL